LSCSICTHRVHLESINLDICSGLSVRAIGKKYGIGIATISRHRAHVPKGQLEAAIVVPPSTGSLSDQLKALIEDTRRVARKAEQSGHLQSAVAALKTINGHLELLAKLSGELQQTGSVAVGVNVNIRQAWEGTSTEVLRWALARHIAQTYSFEPSVIENLKAMAGGPCPDCKRYNCQHDLL
jgi:hypothetical protein